MIRDPNEYFQILDRTLCLSDGGLKYKFDLVHAHCVETYVKLKKNQNQIAWKWKKVRLKMGLFSVAIILKMNAIENVLLRAY